MLQHVQNVQNCAARLICHVRKHERITPVMQCLHWLPIQPNLQSASLGVLCDHKVTPPWLPESVRTAKTLAQYKNRVAFMIC